MSNPFINNNPASTTQNVTPATVTVGAVPTTDNLAQFLQPAVDESMFSNTEITNRYVNRLRRYMASVTSPAGFNGQSAAFFQLGAPTLLWIADWTVSRFNTMPTVPDPTPQDDDWVLLARYQELPKTIVNPGDGTTQFFRITGTYVYGKKTPSADVIDDMSWPRPAWISAAAFPSRRPGVDLYESDLIDALE